MNSNKRRLILIHWGLTSCLPSRNYRLNILPSPKKRIAAIRRGTKCVSLFLICNLPRRTWKFCWELTRSRIADARKQKGRGDGVCKNSAKFFLWRSFFSFFFSRERSEMEQTERSGGFKASQNPAGAGFWLAGGLGNSPTSGVC